MWSSLDDFKVGDLVMIGIYSNDGLVYTGTITKNDEYQIMLKDVIVHELDKAKTYTKYEYSIPKEYIEVMAQVQQTMPYIRNWRNIMLEVDKYGR